MIEYAIWVSCTVAYIMGCGMFVSLSMKNMWFDSGNRHDDAIALLLFTAIWPLPMIFFVGVKLTEWLADRYEW